MEEAIHAIRDWATPENLQPEPITVEIWRELPEEFCRQVEVVNGQAVRCEAPRRAHQAAARRLATVLESAAGDYVALHPGSGLDVSNDFDVILWEVPTATIRRPDLALHNCAPDDVRPLPASYIRVIVEVVSPGSDKTDRVEKMGEYASAGIPFYWLVWISDNRVASIDVHVLPRPPDRRRRIEIFCDAYGIAVPADITDRVCWQQRLVMQNCQALASQGIEPQATSGSAKATSTPSAPGSTGPNPSRSPKSLVLRLGPVMIS